MINKPLKKRKSRIDDMGEPQGHHTKWHKLVTDQCCMIPLVGGVYNSEIHRSQEWDGICQGLGEGGNEELLINRHKVSNYQDE